MKKLDFTKKKVLVTGADGFIGSHLTEQLLQHGADVTALCVYNSFGSYGWLEKTNQSHANNLHLVLGDIRDPFLVNELCKDIDIVFHLAALIAIPFSYVAPQSYLETNVMGTLNVLEACKKNEVGRVVITSTSEVYGTAKYTPIDELHELQAQSPYSASKISADSFAISYARSFDFPVIILRPFNTYGPRQSERAFIPNVIRQLLDAKCKEVRVGNLSPVRDMNYVEDTASAFCFAGLSKDMRFGEVYNVATGVGISMRDLMSKIFSIAGMDKDFVEEDSRIRPTKSEVYELIGKNEKFVLNSGWTPEHSIETGLELTINWWHEQLETDGFRNSALYQI
ncbi:SDR family NAD(P)-dependent oxidoreductase [Alphaproteobacteria bacterium]|nr:SDR family NAD(P)-dependent oxidoreductase [Alphaproteobacteria bacterium]